MAATVHSDMDEMAGFELMNAAPVKGYHARLLPLTLCSI